jgi:hypothetical protein
MGISTCTGARKWVSHKSFSHKISPSLNRIPPHRLDVRMFRCVVLNRRSFAADRKSHTTTASQYVVPRRNLQPLNYWNTSSHRFLAGVDFVAVFFPHLPLNMSTALFRPNSKIRGHEGLNLETVNDRIGSTGVLRFGYTSCNVDANSQ